MAGRLILNRLGRSLVAPTTRFWAPTAIRGAAQAAAEEEDDIVVSIFKEEQQKFRSFIEASKDVSIPMSGDKKAVEDYHKKMSSIKAKLGIPSDSEKLQNILESELQQSEGDVRSFVSGLEGTIGDQAFQSVLDVLDEVESKTGYALTFGDNPPYLEFVQSMKGILSEHGISPEADPAELGLEAEAERIKILGAEAQTEMEAAKTRHGLGFVKVDAKALTPTCQ